MAHTLLGAGQLNFPTPVAQPIVRPLWLILILSKRLTSFNPKPVNRRLIHRIEGVMAHYLSYTRQNVKGKLHRHITH
jgi:hypothetical protein